MMEFMIQLVALPRAADLATVMPRTRGIDMNHWVPSTTARAPSPTRLGKISYMKI